MGAVKLFQAAWGVFWRDALHATRGWHGYYDSTICIGPTTRYRKCVLLCAAIRFTFYCYVMVAIYNPIAEHVWITHHYLQYVRYHLVYRYFFIRSDGLLCQYY